MKAFYCLGEEFKKYVCINNIESEWTRNWFDLYTILLDYEFINSPEDQQYLIKMQMTKKALTKLIRTLNWNESIILEDYENWDWKIKVYIWSNDEISNILPSILCPNYKPIKKSFRLQNLASYWIDYIFSYISLMNVIIRRNNRIIDVLTTVGNTYQIDHCEDDKAQKRIDKILASWPITNWVWKPKYLTIFDSDQQVINNIKKFPYIWNIRGIKWNISFNVDELYQILNLMYGYKSIPTYIDLNTANDDI